MPPPQQIICKCKMCCNLIEAFSTYGKNSTGTARFWKVLLIPPTPVSCHSCPLLGVNRCKSARAKLENLVAQCLKAAALEFAYQKFINIFISQKRDRQRKRWSVASGHPQRGRKC